MSILGSLKDVFVTLTNGKRAIAVNSAGEPLDSLIVDANGNPVEIDVSTRALVAINHAHHEKHEGSDFFLLYSVPSLGAMTTPDDMITLTFKTPDTLKWGHFTFRVRGAPGLRVRLIEAPTGGATGPTGSFNILNSDRNSIVESTFLDLVAATGKISYDATLATGGITLWDEYIPGSTGPLAGGQEGGHDEEIILKQNTTYQISLFGTSTDPATIKVGWYEHTGLV